MTTDKNIDYLALQEELKHVKHKIFEARQALKETMLVRSCSDTTGTAYYADRHFAVVESYLNLALLALAEGRERMQELER